MIKYNIGEKEHNSKKIIKVALAVIIILAVIVTEGLSAFIVKKFDGPKERLVDKTPLSYGIRNYENVNFKSNKKDITLSGWILKSKNSKKTIIMCHGYTDNRIYQYSDGKVVINFIEFAKNFINAGYNVMLFDFRGHGNMAGKAPVTLGFNEQQDLIGAIKYIKNKGLGAKIGVIGFSMGAATALSCLDKTKDISFVIADSPFSDLKEYLENNMPSWTGFPKYPFTPLVLFNFELLDQVNYSKVSPKNSVKKTKVPILLIHGLKDTTIPCRESIIIKNNIKNSSSKLVLFKNADHISSYYSDPQKYKKAVLGFIKENDK